MEPGDPPHRCARIVSSSSSISTFAGRSGSSRAAARTYVPSHGQRRHKPGKRIRASTGGTCGFALQCDRHVCVTGEKPGLTTVADTSSRTSTLNRLWRWEPRSTAPIPAAPRPRELALPRRGWPTRSWSSCFQGRVRVGHAGAGSNVQGVHVW